MPRAKPKTFSEWLAAQGDRAAAERIGVSRITVRSWRLGYRAPRPEMAQHLIKISRGALDWDAIYGEQDRVHLSPGGKAA